MTKSPNLLFLAGSARAASQNKRLARLGAELAKEEGFGATFVDLADYPLPLYDGDIEATEGLPEKARALEALLQTHNGVFISCPEYNSSITPLLKNTLDWLSRIRNEKQEPAAAFKSSVFALGAVSPGGMGGLRGLNAVRSVLHLGLGALVLPDQIAVPRASEAWDSDGSLANKDLHGRFKELVQKLGKTADALYG